MFECENCGKIFNHKKNYNYHIERGVCQKENKFKCELCDNTYKNKRNLIEHLIKIHNINTDQMKDYISINPHYINDIKCSLCGHKFSRVSCLNKHLLSNCCVKKSQIINNNSTTNMNNNNGASIGNNSGTVNVNNTNNTNNYNVNINNFGEEKVDQDKLIKLIQKTNMFNINDLFMNYIIMKHVQTPENKNLFVKHMYGGQLYVFKKKWEKALKEVIFEKIKIATIDDINDCITNNKHLNNAILSSVLDKLEYESPKKFNKDINDVLYKSKEILGKNYEETKNFGK